MVLMALSPSVVGPPRKELAIAANLRRMWAGLRLAARRTPADDVLTGLSAQPQEPAELAVAGAGCVPRLSGRHARHGDRLFDLQMSLSTVLEMGTRIPAATPRAPEGGEKGLTAVTPRKPHKREEC